MWVGSTRVGWARVIIGPKADKVRIIQAVIREKLFKFSLDTFSFRHV